MGRDLDEIDEAVAGNIVGVYYYNFMPPFKINGRLS